MTSKILDPVITTTWKAQVFLRRLGETWEVVYDATIWSSHISTLHKEMRSRFDSLQLDKNLRSYDVLIVNEVGPRTERERVVPRPGGLTGPEKWGSRLRK